MSRPIAALVLLLALPPESAPAQDAQDGKPDPNATLMEEVRTHALFGRLKLLPGQACAPFVLFLEEPRQEDPGRVATLNELYAPWLGKLGELFDRELIRPNTLERPEGAYAHAVFVLDGPAAFRNAQRYQTETPRHPMSIVYVSDPGFIATMYQPAYARRPAHEVRRPLLHRAVVEMAMAYYRGGLEQPLEAWFFDGLATYMTAHGEESQPADLDNPPPDEESLDLMKDVLSDEARRAGHVFTIAELVAADTGQARMDVLRIKSTDAGAPFPGREGTEKLYRAQAALWVHFLFRGDSGRHRESARRYFAKLLQDKGGVEEMALTFAVRELDELDEGFLRHVDGLLGGGIVPSTGSADAFVRPERPPAVVPELTADPRGADEALAFALGIAGNGDVDGAIAELEVALLREREPDGRDSIGIELERLRELKKSRDAFLAAIVGTKKKVRITRDGERVAVGIERIEGDEAVLAKNKLDLERISVNEIPAGDLVQAMGKETGEYGEPWIRAYGLCLAGDRRWSNYVEADDPRAKLLALDGEGRLPRLIEEGAALAALDGLARRPLPLTPFQAREASTAILAALSEHAGTTALRKKTPGIRILAEKVWAVVYDSEGLEGLLAGKVENLPDGRVRVTYEFSDPKEAADFVKTDGYLADRRADRFEVKKSEASSRLEVKGGNLEGDGQACYRHVVAFEEPTVRYELIYGRTKSGEALQANFLIGICDDGAGSFIGAFDLFDLEVTDRASRLAKTNYAKASERILLPARGYELELRHVGEKAELWVDGIKRREIEAGPRKEGSVFLWLHSGLKIAVPKIVIEGKVAAGSSSKARKDWVAAKLAELGFPE